RPTTTSPSRTPPTPPMRTPTSEHPRPSPLRDPCRRAGPRGDARAARARDARRRLDRPPLRLRPPRRGPHLPPARGRHAVPHLALPDAALAHARALASRGDRSDGRTDRARAAGGG